MTSHGLSAGEAGALYVTLAVGDALVASVPALLLSIAAAVIVTRVSDTRDLTGQIGGQFADPKIWLPVACILFAIGCIPAMPQMIFLPLSGGAFMLWRALRNRKAIQEAYVEPVAAPDPSKITIDEVTDQTLVTIQLGYGLIHLTDEKHGAPLIARLTGLRKQMCQNFGFVVPPFRIEDSFDVDPEAYRITLGGTPIGSGKLRANRLLAIDTGEVMHSHAVPGEATVDPSFGCPALWIEAGSRDLAVAEGYLVVDAESVIATQISQLLAGRAADLLGPDQVRDLVDFLRGRHGQLIETVTPQPLSLAALTRVLKSLLLDGISLRHALRIFSSLSQAAQRTNEHDRLIDLIRADLGSMLVGDVCPPDAKLPVITLAAQLEEMVVGGMQDPASGEIIIEPDLARSIGERIGAILQQRHPDDTRPALIVQPRARRALTGLLKLRAPGVLVLSINELPSAQPIEVIAVIGGESPEIPADEPQAYSPEMETLAA